jgi:uncharacterized membrane protein
MKPLFALLGTFTASLFGIRLFGEGFDFSMAGRIAMSAMLIFTAVGHFVFVQGMTMMIPSFIPFKKEIVYLTGIIEVAAAIGLLIPKFQNLVAWLLLLFFLLILPANINAAINKIDYQKGTTDGDGLAYLWFRVPLQVFFMVWVYFFAIRLQ